jgi:hypothetical protein
VRLQPLLETKKIDVSMPKWWRRLHIYQRHMIPLEAGMASVRKDKEMKINMCVFV